MTPSIPARFRRQSLPSCALVVLGLATSVAACSSEPEPSSNAGGMSSTGGSAVTGVSCKGGGAAPGTAGQPGTSGSAGGSVGGSANGAGGSSGGAAAGGTAGGSGGTTGGSGGTSTVGTVSDDFEGGTGTVPDATKWSIFNSAASGGGNSVVVTTDQAHSGTRAIKVAVTQGGAMLMTKVGLPPASGALYYRAWARFTSGASAASAWTNHVTFIEAGGLLDNGDVDQGDEARLGGQNGKISANLSKGDGLSPSPWSMPCPLCTDPPASDKWVCIEGLFDFPNQKIAAWIDNVQVVKAEAPADWHAASTYPAAMKRIGFGWESYGGVANTVYYDDIAIGNERLGCD